jgi:hypothetical protein
MVHSFRFTILPGSSFTVHRLLFHLSFTSRSIMTTSTIKSLLTFSAVVVLFTGCGLLSRRVKVGEEFSLKPTEKVVVAGAAMEIKLEGVGHQTFPNPQPQPLRSSYVSLTVTSGGPPRPIQVSDSIDVGDYTITVKSANPFRSDDGPRCSLIVTRR